MTGSVDDWVEGSALLENFRFRYASRVLPGVDISDASSGATVTAMVAAASVEIMIKVTLQQTRDMSEHAFDDMVEYAQLYAHGLTELSLEELSQTLNVEQAIRSATPPEMLRSNGDPVILAPPPPTQASPPEPPSPPTPPLPPPKPPIAPIVSDQWYVDCDALPEVRFSSNCDAVRSIHQRYHPGDILPFDCHTLSPCANFSAWVSRVPSVHAFLAAHNHTGHFVSCEFHEGATYALEPFESCHLLSLFNHSTDIAVVTERNRIRASFDAPGEYKVCRRPHEQLGLAPTRLPPSTDNWTIHVAETTSCIPPQDGYPLSYVVDASGLAYATKTSFLPCETCRFAQALDQAGTSHLHTRFVGGVDTKNWPTQRDRIEWTAPMSTEVPECVAVSNVQEDGIYAAGYPLRIFYQLRSQTNPLLTTGFRRDPLRPYISIDGIYSELCDLVDEWSGIGKCEMVLESTYYAGYRALYLAWPSSIGIPTQKMAEFTLLPKPERPVLLPFNPGVEMFAGIIAPDASVYIPVDASDVLVEVDLDMLFHGNEVPLYDRYMLAASVRLDFVPADTPCTILAHHISSTMFSSVRVIQDGRTLYLRSPNQLYVDLTQDETRIDTEKVMLTMARIPLQCSEAVSFSLGADLQSYVLTSGRSVSHTGIHNISLGLDDGWTTHAAIRVEKATVRGALAYIEGSGTTTHQDWSALDSAQPFYPPVVRYALVDDHPESNVTVLSSSRVTLSTTSTVSLIPPHSVPNGESFDASVHIQVINSTNVRVEVDNDMLSSIECPGQFQSTRVRVRLGEMDITHRTELSLDASSPLKMSPSGRITATGTGGVAEIHLGGKASGMNVQATTDSVIKPTLIARVMTGWDPNEAKVLQTLEAPGDVGYLFVYATYEDGTVHDLSPEEYQVWVNPSFLTYDADARRVTVRSSATSTSSCTPATAILTVSLPQCRWTLTVPPLMLNMTRHATGFGVQISDTALVDTSSFLTSGALQGLQATVQGIVEVADVILDDRSTYDAKREVSLLFDPPSCGRAIDLEDHRVAYEATGECQGHFFFMEVRHVFAGKFQKKRFNMTVVRNGTWALYAQPRPWCAASITNPWSLSIAPRRFKCVSPTTWEPLKLIGVYMLDETSPSCCQRCASFDDVCDLRFSKNLVLGSMMSEMVSIGFVLRFRFRIETTVTADQCFLDVQRNGASSSRGLVCFAQGGLGLKLSITPDQTSMITPARTWSVGAVYTYRYHHIHGQASWIVEELPGGDEFHDLIPDDGAHVLSETMLQTCATNCANVSLWDISYQPIHGHVDLLHDDVSLSSSSEADLVATSSAYLVRPQQAGRVSISGLILHRPSDHGSVLVTVKENANELDITKISSSSSSVFEMTTEYSLPPEELTLQLNGVCETSTLFSDLNRSSYTFLNLNSSNPDIVYLEETSGLLHANASHFPQKITLEVREKCESAPPFTQPLYLNRNDAVEFGHLDGQGPALRTGQDDMIRAPLSLTKSPCLKDATVELVEWRILFEGGVVDAYESQERVSSSAKGDERLENITNACDSFRINHPSSVIQRSTESFTGKSIVQCVYPRMFDRENIYTMNFQFKQGYAQTSFYVERTVSCGGVIHLSSEEFIAIKQWNRSANDNVPEIINGDMQLLQLYDVGDTLNIYSTSTYGWTGFGTHWDNYAAYKRVCSLTQIPIRGACPNDEWVVHFPANCYHTTGGISQTITFPQLGTYELVFDASRGSWNGAFEAELTVNVTTFSGETIVTSIYRPWDSNTTTNDDAWYTYTLQIPVMTESVVILSLESRKKGSCLQVDNLQLNVVSFSESSFPLSSTALPSLDVTDIHGAIDVADALYFNESQLSGIDLAYYDLNRNNPTSVDLGDVHMALEASADFLPFVAVTDFHCPVSGLDRFRVTFFLGGSTMGTHSQPYWSDDDLRVFFEVNTSSASTEFSPIPKSFDDGNLLFELSPDSYGNVRLDLLPSSGWDGLSTIEMAALILDQKTNRTAMYGITQERGPYFQPMSHAGNTTCFLPP